jgi:hypothetical protein
MQMPPLPLIAALLQQGQAGPGAEPMPPAPSAPMPTLPAAATPPFVPPSSGQPRGGVNPAILQMLPTLFAIGARMGGSPQVGASALQGFQQGQTVFDESQRRDATVAQNQQRIDLDAQRQALAAAQLEEQQRIQAEQRRTAAINTTVDNLRQQKFPNKAAYDQAIAAHETMLANAYGVRPNTLRAMVPFIEPSMADKMATELDRLQKDQPELLKNPAAFIEADWDGDGVPERRQVRDIYRTAGRAIVTDKDGQPIVMAKGADGSAFEVALNAKLERFRVDKQRDPNAKEYDELVEDARRTPPDPTVALLREQLLHDRQNRPAGPAVTPAQDRRINQLSDAFRNDPAVKRANIQAEAVSFVKSLDQNSQNPADDQALIYAFAKAMDPDSVVREGEYATVQKYAQSWLSNLGFNAMRVVENREFLTPQARANMRSTIEKKYGATRAQYDNVRTQFQKQIERITGQPGGDEYLVDYASAFPGGVAPAKTGPTASGAVDAGLRTRAKQILSQGGYDSSDASVDKFLANPKNRALLVGGGK